MTKACTDKSSQKSNDDKQWKADNEKKDELKLENVNGYNKVQKTRNSSESSASSERSSSTRPLAQRHNNIISSSISVKNLISKFSNNSK